MKALIEAAINRSRAVYLILIFLFLAGTSTYINIAKEATPDVKVPVIYASLRYPGISPEDSERLLIKPLEQKLKTIEGIKQMKSAAEDGGGYVLLEFYAGLNSDKALADVRERVNQAKALFPKGTDEPQIHEVNLGLFPVLVVQLSGNVSDRSLYKVAQRLKEEIQSHVPSVLEARIVGDRKESIEIVVNPRVLEGYVLDLPRIIEVFQHNNALISAGVLDTGHGRIPVKVPGLFTNPLEILNAPIASEGSTVLKFKDVAEVRRGFKDPAGFAFDKGQPAVAIEISKRSGQNIINTIEHVRDVVEKLRPTFPESLNINFTQDKSDDIKEMLADLQNSIIAAILLVLSVMVIAFGWRSALLVGLAVPGSFLIGILVIGALGLTINMVVLFSLILSVGMLVDAAIIVVEYADRKMLEGETPMKAFKMAAQRMAWPAITSTVTIVAAFFPLLFWPGVMGQFMKFLPITLVATLTASILMAVIFIPTLGGHFGQHKATAERKSIISAETGDLKELKGTMTGHYVGVLNYCLDRPGKVLAFVFSGLIGVIILTKTFGRGVEFFPDVEPTMGMIEVRARGNLSVYEVRDLVKEVEGRVLKIPGIKSVYTNTDRSAAQQMEEPFSDTVGFLTLEFEHWNQRLPANQIFSLIQEKTKDLPGIVVETHKQKEGPSSGKDIQIEVSADEGVSLESPARRIREIVYSVEGLQGVEDSMPLKALEWSMTVDRAKAAQFNATASSIGAFVQMVTEGYKIGTIRPDDAFDEVDVVIRLNEKYRSIQHLQDMKIKTSYGNMPLSAVVKQEFKPKQQRIERVNGKRVIMIKADVKPGFLADQKIKEIQEKISQENVMHGVSIAFKGQEGDKQETSDFLSKAFFMTIFLIALILVLQFNSFFSVGLVLSAIVLSTIGVMVGLMVTQQPFGIVMGGIGVITLAGIIVSNNIILIDTYDVLKKTIKDPREALLRTGAQRLRPVFLTKLTTVLGLVPMALKLNIDFINFSVTYNAPSSQWWVQLSNTIIFGVLFAGVLTLVVTPCAIMIKERRRLSKPSSL